MNEYGLSADNDTGIHYSSLNHAQVDTISGNHRRHVHPYTQGIGEYSSLYTQYTVWRHLLCGV